MNNELYHYGVKGMRWGVRKSVERAVTGIKNAVTNSTPWYIGRGVRRWKNKRAIRSGNKYRIAKRFNKMNEYELQQAMDRVKFADILSTPTNQMPSGNKYLNRFVDQLASKTINSTTDSISRPIGSYVETSINAAVAGKSVGEEVSKRAERNLTQNNQSDKKKNPKRKRLKHMEQDSNYLSHYGVLGMKWGMRKAENAGTSYTYKSHGQKKWEKRVKKLTGKKNKAIKLHKAKKKLAVYKQRDKNRQNYVKTTSVGAQIARDILLTPIGSGAYTRARASGKSIVQSLGSSAALWDTKMSEMGTARVMVDPKSGSLNYYKKKQK